MKQMVCFGAIVALLVTAACNDSPTAFAGPPELSGDTVALAGGLKYIDASVGAGAEARAGQRASVHYTGWLAATGEQFDSSLSREPFPFTIGAGSVIAGWDRGIPGMRVGGRRRLIIPPSLGYGSQGNNRIPPNATLIFDVELRALGT